MTPPGQAPGAPAGSYSLSGFENVNLFNGNLNFNLPLLKIGGRGRVGASVNLAIDSLKWEMTPVRLTDPNVGQPPALPYFNIDDYKAYSFYVSRSCSYTSTVCTIRWADYATQNFPALEFIKPLPGTKGYSFFPMARPYVGAEEFKPGYGPGVLRGRFAKARDEYLPAEDTTGPPPDPESLHVAQMLYRLTFVDSDGTEHEFVDIKSDGEPKLHSFTQDVDRGRIFASTDGSGITFISEYQMGDFEIPPTGLLFFPDGTRAHVANELIDWTQDTDGNRITYDYGRNSEDRRTYRRVTEITDTLGRKVVITYADFDTVMYDELKFNGVAGTLDRSIKVWYSKLGDALTEGQTLMSVGELFPTTIRISVDSPDDPEKFNPVVPKAVEMPDGRKYNLTYNSFAELAHVKLPTGAAIKYEYPGITTASPFLGLIPDRRIRERYIASDGVNWESKQTFTPTDTNGAADDISGWGTDITVETFDLKGGQNRLVSKQTHYFHGHPGFATRPELFYPAVLDGREYKVVQYDTIGAADVVLRTEERMWGQRCTPAWWSGFTTSRLQRTAANAPARDPRLSEVRVTLENGLASRKVFKYSDEVTVLNPNPDPYNNLTDTYEYDYATAGETGRLLRHTHTDYVRALSVGMREYDYACSPTPGGPCESSHSGDGVIHIRNLPASIEVRDGATDSIVSRNEFSYDEMAYTADDYGPLPTDFPGFVASTMPARGHLTTSRVWLDTLGPHTDLKAYLQAHIQYDRFGNAIKTWDDRGNASEVKFSADYKYALPSQTVSADPDGAGPLTPLTTNTVYDLASGAVTDIYDANNQHTHVDYEAGAGKLDRLKKVTRPDGGWTEYDYGDVAGNLYLRTRTLRKALPAEKALEGYQFFDGLGRILRSTRRTGETIWAATATEYDGLGRALKITNPFKASDNAGVIPQDTLWTTTEYDALGRARKVRTPDGATAYTLYDGNRILITDQASKQRISKSDALGRLSDVWEVTPDNPTKYPGIEPLSFSVTEGMTKPGAGYHTSYVYDVRGNLRKVEQGAQRRYFAYDSLGRLTRASNPEQEANNLLALDTGMLSPLTDNNNGWSLSYMYDENGNLKKRTDARGVVTSYNYDALDRLTDKSYTDFKLPQGGTISTPQTKYFYDTQSLPAGAPVYDRGKSLGHLVAITYGGVSSTTGSYTGEYDSMGRPHYSAQVTALSDATGSLVTQPPYVFGYEYNLDGSLKSEKYPSGRVVESEYDEAGRLAGVKKLGGEYYAGGDPNVVNNPDVISYTAHGAVAAVKLGNGLTERAMFNGRLQVAEIGLSNAAGTDLLKLDYVYESYDGAGRSRRDNSGNVLSQKIRAPGFEAFQVYDYDALNRLNEAREVNAKPCTDANGGSNCWRQVYKYDRYGNRNFDTETTLPALNATLTDVVNNPLVSEATNRLVEDQDRDGRKDYEYDLAGNVIRNALGQTFAYDGDNMQITFNGGPDPNTGGASYAYDATGRRVKKVTTSGTTLFVYDAGGALVAEYSNEAVQPGAGGTKYLTADSLGSPRVITDKDGKVVSRHDYAPFGEEVFAGRTGEYQQDSVRQQFTGQERDRESGLDYFDARYYSNAQGRFTSIDPLAASGRPGSPQTWNRYAYVLNNPLKLVDPTGMFQIPSQTQRGDAPSPPPNPKPSATQQTTTDTGRGAANGTQQSQPGMPPTLVIPVRNSDWWLERHPSVDPLTYILGPYERPVLKEYLTDQGNQMMNSTVAANANLLMAIEQSKRGDAFTPGGSASSGAQVEIKPEEGKRIIPGFTFGSGSAGASTVGISAMNRQIDVNNWNLKGALMEQQYKNGTPITSTHADLFVRRGMKLSRELRDIYMPPAQY